MGIPTILVIFGATGDLVRRKLAPALFHLWKARMTPEHFRIVGFSRREWGDKEYREYIGEVLRSHPDTAQESIPDFLRLLAYSKGDFNTAGDYRSLAETLNKIDGEWGACSNKLFYLAATPEFYRTVFENLADSGLTIPCGPNEGWTRVIVEKPFGKDLKTAEELDELLGKLFREEQIYRIDHYLAKEMLQNILTFRFSNNLFETNWSNETIEKIEIRLWESLGAEERGAFYDGLGALRDVGQNHLLQMLALVTMERPENFSAEAIRARRQELLKQFEIPSSLDIENSAVRAQYEGYRGIKGVSPDSRTETYFKLQARIDSPRWKGVKMTLESGKRMPEQRKEVSVVFRHPSPCLCFEDTHYQNKIVFGLEPEEKISIHFWTKKPGLAPLEVSRPKAAAADGASRKAGTPRVSSAPKGGGPLTGRAFQVEERTFEFRLREAEKRTQYVEEYEKLLLDCITGDQTLFVSTEEVRAMWRFIDPIVRAWDENIVPLKFYKPGVAMIV